MKQRTSKDLRREPLGGDVPSLTRALNKVNRGVTEQKAEKAARPKAASRVDKRGFVIYLHPDVNRALRLLALELDQTVHRLGLDAIRLLLDRHEIEMPHDLLTAKLLPKRTKPPRAPASVRIHATR